MDRVDFLYAARRQGYVLTAASGRDLGLSPDVWAAVSRHPDVARPFRGVLVLPGPGDGPERRIRAGVAAVRCPVRVTGWSAAYLYGLVTTAPSRVHLLVPHGSSVAPRADRLRITETSAFPDGGPILRGDLPAVGSARMLCDLAADADDKALLHLGVDARFRRLLGPDDLLAELTRRARFAGRARIRRLADCMRDDGSDSGFEFLVCDRLVEAGLDPVGQQVRVRAAGRTRRIDIVLPGRVGIECLGLAAHSGRRAFDRDADRRNDLAEHGEYLIYELTWTRFHTDWDAFCQRVARAVRLRTGVSTDS